MYLLLRLIADDCDAIVISCCEAATGHEPSSWQAKSWFNFLYKLFFEDARDAVYEFNFLYSIFAVNIICIMRDNN
jgi:hypothetical protein